MLPPPPPPEKKNGGFILLSTEDYILQIRTKVIMITGTKNDQRNPSSLDNQHLIKYKY